MTSREGFSPALSSGLEESPSGEPPVPNSDVDPWSTQGARASVPIDFQALLAGSPNPYVVMDQDLTIVWMNQAYLRATMRTRQEIVGRRMFDAFPSDPESESFRLLDGSLRKVLQSGEPDEIALIRYDIRNSDGSMDERYWSATHHPLHDRNGKVAYVLQHTVDVTELHRLRALRDGMGLMQRAQAVQERNRDLTDESRQMRALFEQAPGFAAVLSGPDHRFIVANRAYRNLVGGRSLIGETVAEALPEVIEQGFVEILDRVRHSGEPYFGVREKVHLRTDAGGPVEGRCLDFIYQPIFDGQGQVSGVFVQGHDVTEQVEAEERQKLLINELNHRVKNTLSIVQGLAMQSFRRLAGSEVATQTFDSRLTALAAAHSLLTESNWESTRLGETVRSAVAATAGQDADRIRLAGPDVVLRPQLAVALAMIVHELSTNAIKYGALSHESGRVEINWALESDDDERILRIEWTESGGPAVEPPSRRGFGTRLIERGLGAEGGGRVTMDFRSQGLHCAIEANLPSEVE